MFHPHPLITTILPVGMGLLALALIGLSIREALDSFPHVRLIAVGFLLLAVGLLSIALNLHLLGITWHLRNSQKPWFWIKLAGTLGFIFIGAGAGALTGFLGRIPAEQIVGRQAEDQEDQPQEGVWPPPPTIPPP